MSDLLKQMKAEPGDILVEKISFPAFVNQEKINGR